MDEVDRQALDDQIQEAMGSHGAMKRKLRQAVRNGRLPRPSRSIAADSACTFGRWLHQLKSDARVAGSPHFKAVVTAHAAFHKSAGQIARMVENGMTDRAAEMLNEQAFRRSSELLLDEMDAWRRNI
ncbi:CZB domain-containing protein [Marinibacterium sp. SX1]|uniref:CZB domain-containing protein n=1 Tax=Marinibacterium sp. SX1 TaxID=3388424 RepID=UPI003D162509